MQIDQVLMHFRFELAKYGNLSFLGGSSRIEEIRDIEIVNLDVGTKEIVKLYDLIS